MRLRRWTKRPDRGREALPTPVRAWTLLLALGLSAGLVGCAPMVFETALISNPITAGPRGELALVLGEEGGYASLRSCSRLRFWVAEGEECPGGTLYLYSYDHDRGTRAPRRRAEGVLWARFTAQGLLIARAEGWRRTRLALLAGEGREHELLRSPRFLHRAGLRGRWLTYQEARPLRMDVLRLFNDLLELSQAQAQGEGEGLRPEELRFLRDLLRGVAGPLWAFDLKAHRETKLLERVVVHRWAQDALLALTLEGDPLKEPVRLKLLRLEPPKGQGPWARHEVTSWTLEPAALFFFPSLPPEAFLEASPREALAWVALPMEGLFQIVWEGEGEWERAGTAVEVEKLRPGALYPRLSPAGRQLAFLDLEEGGLYVRDLPSGRERRLAGRAGFRLFWLSERELGFAAPLLPSQLEPEEGKAKVKVELRLGEEAEELWVVDVASGGLSKLCPTGTCP